MLVRIETSGEGCKHPAKAKALMSSSAGSLQEPTAILTVRDSTREDGQGRRAQANLEAPGTNRDTVQLPCRHPFEAALTRQGN